MNKDEIIFYTDGSCIGNPGPGGWALIVLYNGKEYKISGGEAKTTNNRMEMTAVLNALKWLHDKRNIKPSELTEKQIKIYSDSNLIIQTINLGWKRKANKDIWAEIEKLRAWLKIEWVWVKAHATNVYNNKVDKLALNEAKKNRV